MIGAIFINFRVLIHASDDVPASQKLEEAKQLTLAIEEALKQLDGSALIVREVRWEGAA